MRGYDPDEPRQRPAIIMRTPAWQAWVTAVAACGFYGAEAFVKPTFATLLFFNFFGTVLALVSLTFTRNQYALEGREIGFRGLAVRKTVRLDRLASISVHRTRGKVPHWKFQLRDIDGSSITIYFDGYKLDERMSLLGGIEPWARQPGIRHDGPTDLALAGKLWWPRRTDPPGTGSAHDKEQHIPARHAKLLPACNSPEYQRGFQQG